MSSLKIFGYLALTGVVISVLLSAKDIQRYARIASM